MTFASGFSTAAALIADPARARMLTFLLDGRAYPAGQLAEVSGVTPQTASSHLAQLLAGGLVTCEAQGRHRYYRLTGPRVAQALEHLATLATHQPVKRPALSTEARELRFCRSCYDHLAGQIGVAVTQALQTHRFIAMADDQQFRLTPEGAAWFEAVGIDTQALKPTRRGIARPCLDWTERTYHLAGPLGRQLLDTLIARGWLRRAKDTRRLQLTPKGRLELKQRLDIDAETLARLPQYPPQQGVAAINSAQS
ncbi:MULTISPECIES: ArsR family transcriptional regulator [unclassified Beijerinckia]|uniref:ArsR family transcriptional regulator n=1 Tax=unclassified Beijerinckia TaxID=2638183 RepID=UPI000894C267|nr:MULTISPECIES: ArsR family transcriptional regulator [unclassified Beijerinckia]MDH7796256.1 DNA-binding transcriptional ArsR family regulator [Beijerinckia sp. GAS462]SEC37184.1 transcriptional regulator, ArsR family [Beijerinckia sp. 28-YEA-48]